MAPRREQEARDLAALEREGWEALTTGRSREFYEGLLAAQAVMVFPHGVMERADAIEGMAQAQPWVDYRLDEMTVHPLGEGLAVVTYRVRAQRDGDDTYEALLASTYVWLGGDWRMVLHQHSPMVGGASP